MARSTHDQKKSRVQASVTRRQDKKHSSQKKKGGERKVDLENVYEYNTGKKHRRAAVDTKLGREDEAEYLSDSKDADNDPDLERMKARLVKLVQEDDVALGSEDEDEEIDSDDAFEESDDERFAGFTFKSSRKPTKARPVRTLQESMEVDLSEGDDKIGLDKQEGTTSGDEDEEDEEGGEDGDFFDVLDILDGKADLESHSSAPSEAGGDAGTTSKTPGVATTAGPSRAGGRADDSDESDGDDGALARLGTFIDGLEKGDGVKRKLDATGDEENPPARQKRRIIVDRTEAQPEGEYSTRAGSLQKLSLDDFLNPLANSQLKKSTKVLKTSAPNGGALSAPLPLRTQDRLDREAAYEQTKDEVDKWKSSMKRLREAEHLSFPLQQHAETSTSSAALAAKFKPSNDLENAVDRLLQTAKLADGDLPATEELQMAHLSVEEVEARRNELRRMRDLMFRAEVKAKRIAKIKSKAFRKLQKKSRQKAIDKLREAGELEDDSLNPEAEKIRAEVERARARASLRHKGTSKLLRNPATVEDPSGPHTRESIMDDLDRRDALEKKIHGRTSEDSEDEDVSEDEEGAGPSTINARLNAFVETGEDIEASQGKGVFSMKFMREARRREEDAIRQSVTTIQDANLSDGGEVEMEENADTLTSGRMIFAPQPKDLPENQSNKKATISSNAEQAEGSAPSKKGRNEARQSSNPHGPNPWLRGSVPGAVKTRNEVVISKESSAADKSAYALKRQLDQNVGELDDSLVEISTSEHLRIDNHDLKGTEMKSHRNRPPLLDSDSDAEADHLRHPEKPTFQQRDLIAMAFAGDNVVEGKISEAALAKGSGESADLDEGLPGWGAWSGPGTKQFSESNKKRKTVASAKPSRKSDSTSHVQLSAKKDKRVTKYHIKDIPYPFTSRAQYEASLETPLGSDWNTRIGFQRGTLPRVMKKMGTVIEPIRKMA